MSWEDILKEDKIHTICRNCGEKNPISSEDPELLDESKLHLRKPCVSCGQKMPFGFGD